MNSIGPKGCPPFGEKGGKMGELQLKQMRATAAMNLKCETL